MDSYYNQKSMLVYRLEQLLHAVLFIIMHDGFMARGDKKSSQLAKFLFCFF